MAPRSQAEQDAAGRALEAQIAYEKIHGIDPSFHDSLPMLPDLPKAPGQVVAAFVPKKPTPKR